jgi:branched-chain amino acid transport system ATP-binding protein
MAESSPLLEVSGLAKAFGGVKALSQVDLKVGRGETLGIIGPNGAGKTTLFNCITGALEPNAGSILFEGRELVGLTSDEICRRGIARTYQNVRPYRLLTASQNVMVSLVNRTGHSRRLSVARAEAIDLLAMAGLEGYADWETHRLNLFQRKRVELARALGTGARLILLDEVMAGLNPSESDRAGELLHRLQAEIGLTVVAIEHVMRIIMAVSDRVVALDQGRVIAVGTPSEVANDPHVKAAYLGDEIA